jgi:hypothetical protein
MIVRGALDEAVARLDELSPSPEMRNLRVRALAYRAALDRWLVLPPSEEQRSALMRVVLELDIEVKRLAQTEARR